MNPQPSALGTIAGSSDIRQRQAAATASPEWTDDLLMAAVCTADEAAFGILYERYADLVFATSLRVLADRQLAEDAVQDIFTRLWNHPQAFVAARGRFLSWLVSVTRNRAVDELRARGRRWRREAECGPDSDELIAALPGSDGDDPARSAQMAEDRAEVKRALASLPCEQRQVLELAYFDGLTQQEIALHLGEPLGTVKTRIRLGMQKLRRVLGDKV